MQHIRCGASIRVSIAVLFTEFSTSVRPFHLRCSGTWLDNSDGSAMAPPSPRAFCSPKRVHSCRLICFPSPCQVCCVPTARCACFCFITHVWSSCCAYHPVQSTIPLYISGWREIIYMLCYSFVVMLIVNHVRHLLLPLLALLFGSSCMPAVRYHRGVFSCIWACSSCRNFLCFRVHVLRIFQVVSVLSGFWEGTQCGTWKEQRRHTPAEAQGEAGRDGNFGV